jgi:hypothetical protein
MARGVDPTTLPCVVASGDVHDLRVLAVIEADDALSAYEVGHIVKDLTVHLNLLGVDFMNQFRL